MGNFPIRLALLKILSNLFSDNGENKFKESK